MNDFIPTESSSTSGHKPTAGQWERAVSYEWLTIGREAYVARQRYATDFTTATVRFFKQMITTPDAASDVVSQLRSALERCDELTFNDDPDAFAYLLWHQIDRYHRVSQTLDRLFQRGILPLAKPDRPLRVLEVGSGPAPASYAAIDYYVALADWAKSRGEVFQISSNTEAHTLDRGSAWQQIVHGLSEELLHIEDRQSVREGGPFRTRFFDITYPEFANFSPGQLHVSARERMKREILDEDELGQFQLDSDYQDVNQYAAKRVAASAYDLIIVANFVTSTSMMESLKAELENLANSLVPGGVLLTLSGRNQKYKDLWNEYAALPQVNRLEHVLDEVMQAHQDPDVHGRVARSTVSLLTHLKVLAEQGLDSAELPQDIAEAMRLALTDPSSIAAVQAVTYPSFQVHGFVRRDRAISSKDRKRIAGRRGSDAYA
ncbi:hypothetical protein ACIQC5_11745 [Paenarthrobacter sp. NPDC092416]|uniref:hypothetical protein n=1 Tax=Paenarthrobacter sp. NPDC092416 TaxID=3364386 RepID=UPI0037F19404